MYIDSSINIVGIFALIALISPILTAIFNFLFQLYFKQLELYELTKREALTNFINDFSLYLYTPDSDINIRCKAITSIHLLQAYFNVKPELQVKILEAFNNKNSKVLNQAIIELSKQVNKKIK